MQNPFSLSSYVCTITRVSADVDDVVHQSADSCFAASSILCSSAKLALAAFHWK